MYMPILYVTYAYILTTYVYAYIYISLSVSFSYTLVLELLNDVKHDVNQHLKELCTISFHRRCCALPVCHNKPDPCTSLPHPLSK